MIDILFQFLLKTYSFVHTTVQKFGNSPHESIVLMTVSVVVSITDISFEFEFRTYNFVQTVIEK
jgi:hypothetical protein